MLAFIFVFMLYFKAYEKSAELPWLVFVHGAGGSGLIWSRQITFFREHFNLLIPDLRDHGNSKGMPEPEEPYNFDLIAKDVLQLLDHLKIRKAHFCGVSMGCMVVRKIVSIRNGIADSIVFSGAIYKMSFKLHLLTVIGRQLARVISFRNFYNLYSRIILPKKNHQTSRKLFVRESMKMTQDEFDKWLHMVKDLRSLLSKFFKKEIEAPCMLIMGSEDHLFLKPALEYSNKSEHTSFELIENCGHVCNIEKAEAFNEISLRFLQRKDS
mgnify:CR=1 FL=1